MRTVALDLSGRSIDVCEFGAGGVIERRRVRDLSGLKGMLGPNTPPARVAFEACREGWHVAARLREWGHEPAMVDTTRVKQIGIGRHGRKNDRIDTETLAVALYEDRIPLAHILSPHRQELRFQLSVRRALVETRAQYVAMIREMVRARGGRIPKCAARDFLRKVRQVELDEATLLLVAPLRQVLETLEGRIGEVDLKLEQLCTHEPVILSLMTTPGVALVVGAAYVSVIDQPSRFRNAHQVFSYLGLVPSERSSGERRRLGAISKMGNTYLRALLVEAGWCLLRCKDGNPLTVWGRAVAQRRGGRIAAVAVARRLAGILWAIWRDGTVFDPERVARTSAAGLNQRAALTQWQAERMAVAKAKVARRRRLAVRALASAEVSLDL
jgi:transposase